MRGKKNSWKDFALGMVIMALLAVLTVPALATSGKKEMGVEYTGIHIHVDGIPITGLGGDKAPFVSDGTTYLPVRAIGEALGKVVRWDGPSHTVYITDPTTSDTAAAATESSGSTPTGKKAIEVDYVDIKLVVNGKEVTPKDVNGNMVEPFAYNGTTYLPVRAVGEALGKTVRWDGETNTVHLGELPQGTYLVDACKVPEADENNMYRAADHRSYAVNGTRYTQGFSLDEDAIFCELGGKYESLTFDYFGSGTDVYLDGEKVQKIEETDDTVQTVTVPLNYAQTIYFTSGNGCIGTAVLHGERAVEKYVSPALPANATYLADVCGRELSSAEDTFGNQYANCIYSIFFLYDKAPLNGKYKTLKATIIPTATFEHIMGGGFSGGYSRDDALEKRHFAFSVDGNTVKEIELSAAMGPQTIEIPLNYGMELNIEGRGYFLADAYLE